MTERVYLVNVTAAQASRDRQLAREDKERRRQWAKAQAKQLKADLPKAPKTVKAKRKPKDKAPQAQKNYHRAIVPYMPGMGKQFYDTAQWMTLRYKALREYGLKCHCCGATDTELHVDHIKPRSRFPQLELEFSNLQILCRACNLGKSNTDSIDWRTSGTIAQSA